jgi:hypothetical protein
LSSLIGYLIATYNLSSMLLLHRHMNIPIGCNLNHWRWGQLLNNQLKLDAPLTTEAATQAQCSLERRLQLLLLPWARLGQVCGIAAKQQLALHLPVIRL